MDPANMVIRTIENSFLSLFHLIDNLTKQKEELEEMKTILVSKTKNSVNDVVVKKYAYGTPPLDILRERWIDKIRSSDCELYRKEIRRHIEYIRNILDNNSFDCPKCNGKGIVAKPVTISEDGYTRREISATKCHTCKGTGKIELNNYPTHRYALSITLEILLLIDNCYFKQAVENHNETER